MSAPLVVNVAGGAVWLRQEAVRDGLALYAPEKCGACPEFVMVTYAELEARGIVGSADVLPVPVPVGPEPQALRAEWRVKLAALIGDAKPARDGLLTSFGESIRDRREHDHTTQREDWFCMNLSAYMGERMAPVLRRLLDAEARVAELEAERHSTNEALSDAAVRMRADRDRIAELESLTPARVQTCRVCGAGYTYGESCSSCLFRARMASELQARGLDGEHYPLVHHSYRVGHDLPETGGVQ